jgi:hypothetical protein
MKTTKMFDNLKEANNYKREQIKLGFTVNIHAHKEHLSYKGKNHTFYDVTIVNN